MQNGEEARMRIMKMNCSPNNTLILNVAAKTGKKFVLCIRMRWVGKRWQIEIQNNSDTITEKNYRTVYQSVVHPAIQNN